MKSMAAPTATSSPQLLVDIPNPSEIVCVGSTVSVPRAYMATPAPVWPGLPLQAPSVKARIDVVGILVSIVRTNSLTRCR